MIGQTLAHYRITAALGAGGMGEVFRATDTKLNREVAIKVLPPEVAGDPERLARFQREAQLLAALNHPNIAAIHGLEEAGGTPFLALELVEGEDLKERLEKDALPIDEALEIARQIAEALEEAHNKGIVHRDLKPANVKLTPDGNVKVLDFGLAKAWGGDAEAGGSSIDLSQSPTLARTGTLAGVILGTAAYMSPEQAAGKPVDKRADIWSFGVVLFEMLTGSSLFTGETASEVMASVIKEEPAWESLPPACPPAVTKLLRRCLRKKPRERLQDIGDARIELTDVLAGGDVEPGGDPAGAVHAAQEEARRLRARERRVWALVVLALAGLAAVLAWRGGADAPATTSVVRAELRLPPGYALAQSQAPEISPDGRHVALVLQQRGEPSQLWLHSLDEREARLVANTEGATFPFWAPDSQSVAFVSEDRLQAVRVDDGVVQRICALPGPRFNPGDWSEGGLIVFSSAGPGDTYGTGYSLFTVPAQGGRPEPLGTLDESRGETRHLFPQFLPGGAEVLFAVTATDSAHAGFDVLRLDAPAERRRLDAPQLTMQTTRLASSNGRSFLFYEQDGTLLAQPFDDDAPGLSGVATPIADRVASFAAMKQFSVSATGTVVHLPSAPAPEQVRLVWIDRGGEERGAVDGLGGPWQFVLSQDGARVAVQTNEPRDNLWLLGTRRGLASRATFDAGEHQIGNPVWSPDGREIAYSTPCDARYCLFRVALAEGAAPTLVVESELEVYPECWSNDDTLVYLEGGLENRAVRTLAMGGGAEPELLLQTGFGLDETQVSPDGRWLAYLSDDSGQLEVYVRPFRRPGERIRVSPDGAGQPKWRGDGRELFYVSRAGELTAVEIRETGDTLELGMPSPLFEVSTIGDQDPVIDLYAPMPDGQRFLVAAPAQSGPEEPLQLTLNWPALVE